MIEKQLLWYNDLKGLNVACLRYFNAAGYDIKGRINKIDNDLNCKIKSIIPITI